MVAKKSRNWLPAGWTSQVKVQTNGRKIRLVVKRNESPDWLPNGWIMEVKSRQSGSAMGRSYKCYIDPSTGFKFYSKPQVSQYLKSIKPSSHSNEQKKKGFPVQSEKKETSTEKRLKITHTATRRQLFAGEESSGLKSTTLPETKGSKKRQGRMVSARKSETPRKAIRKTEKKEVKKVSDNIKPDSPKVPNALQEKTILEMGMEKEENARSQNSSTKTKNKKGSYCPSRSSKRLAGIEPELSPNVGPNERALRAAVRNSIKTKANQSPAHGLSPSGEPLQENHMPAHGISPSEEPSEENHMPSPGVSPSGEPLEKNLSHMDQADSKGQTVEKLDTEKKDEENPVPELCFPFGDSVLDPCLEFAFKTLTGEIPIEDNLEIQGSFLQQIGNSYNQMDGGLALPDIGLHSFFQNDISTQFDALEKATSKQQFSMSTSLPPENVNFPIFSGIGPQQSSLEEKVESQRDIH